MKITGIKTYKFDVPAGEETHDRNTGALLSSNFKPWLFLKIETDTDISGWGEGSGGWLAPSVEPTLHEWSVLLIDQDPLRVVALTEDIPNRLPFKGGPVFATALAAINMALYDIAGKAWGVPVHTILGGRQRDRVRVYRGGNIFSDPEQAVAEARRVQSCGVAGLKGNPLENRTWPMDGTAIDHSTSCVTAVREELGPGFDILLDTHGSPTPELSIEFARCVAPLRPLFLEEPVKVGSTEALLQVSRQSPVPIATGEKLFSLQEFQPLIDQRACAFLQPDVAHCGGITGLMDIARAARQAQMLMAPHMDGGPISFAATLHADAVSANFLIQETAFFEQLNRYVEHPWVIEDGYVNISDQPGLGIEVKEQDIAELTYEPPPYRQYRHADGSWKGW